jgi:hypothetical protein
LEPRHRPYPQFWKADSTEGLLNREFARTLLSWRHSGFSIDSGTRIYDTEARQGLCQFILYFQGKQVHISCLDFIAQVTLHIPRRASIFCVATGCMPP